MNKFTAIFYNLKKLKFSATIMVNFSKKFSKSFKTMVVYKVSSNFNKQYLKSRQRLDPVKNPKRLKIEKKKNETKISKCCFTYPRL